MFLAEAKSLQAVESAHVALHAAIDGWRDVPRSVMADHGERCCRTAQEWFLAMDYSHMGAGDVLTGPRWIRQRYTWGPTRWPLHWCEALEKKTLDCGALAALAQVAFLSRGVRCHTAQLIQRYTGDDSRNWRRNWEERDAGVSWIKDDLVYHEACAVEAGGAEVRIWDPTASWWVNPKQFEGYGSVLALRILVAEQPQVGQYTWGRHRIPPNQWHPLEHARGDFA